MIVDANGEPFDPKVLKEPQTAAVGLLRKEFQGHPSRGLTPAKLAQIMEQAEQGDLRAQAELFQDMEEKDCHIASEMGKRKMAVAQLDWQIAPLADASAREKKAVSALESRIRDMLDAESVFTDALDAIGHGYSCLELEWKKDAIGWFPEVFHCPPDWFTVHPEAKATPRLRSQAAPFGVALTPFGWIPHIHKTRSGWLPRVGLHRSLAWPYLFKNYSVRDLAELLEIYGLPIRLGKYPSAATENEKKTLMQAVMAVGHHAGGIIPDSMMMDFITATSAGSSDPFTAMIAWCEASQSKAILGGTLTSQTGANGNRSLGEVHNEVRLDIRNSDANKLGITLTRHLLYPLWVLNGLGDENRCPDFIFDTQEPDDLSLYSDALPKLAKAGLKIPLRYVYGKLKIPQPEPDEEILSVGQNEPPPPPENEPAPGAATRIAAASRADDDDPTPVTGYTDRLADDAQTHLKAMLEVIKTAVDQADSLEQLRDDLLALYGDMPVDQLSNVMSLGFAAANLAGRFDVRDETGWND